MIEELAFLALRYDVIGWSTMARERVGAGTPLLGVSTTSPR